MAIEPERMIQAHTARIQGPPGHRRWDVVPLPMRAASPQPVCIRPSPPPRSGLLRRSAAQVGRALGLPAGIEIGPAADGCVACCCSAPPTGQPAPLVAACAHWGTVQAAKAGWAGVVRVPPAHREVWLSSSRKQRHEGARKQFAQRQLISIHRPAAQRPVSRNHRSNLLISQARCARRSPRKWPQSNTSWP